MTSSGVNIRTNASTKLDITMQMSGGVSVLCWLAALCKCSLWYIRKSLHKPFHNAIHAHILLSPSPEDYSSYGYVLRLQTYNHDEKKILQRKRLTASVWIPFLLCSREQNKQVGRRPLHRSPDLFVSYPIPVFMKIIKINNQLFRNCKQR